MPSANQGNADEAARPVDRPEEAGGVALELSRYSGKDFTLSFWRTRAGAEVDQVVYGRHGQPWMT